MVAAADVDQRMNVRVREIVVDERGRERTARVQTAEEERGGRIVERRGEERLEIGAGSDECRDRFEC